MTVVLTAERRAGGEGGGEEEEDKAVVGMAATSRLREREPDNTGSSNNNNSSNHAVTGQRLQQKQQEPQQKQKRRFYGILAVGMLLAAAAVGIITGVVVSQKKKNDDTCSSHVLQVPQVILPSSSELSVPHNDICDWKASLQPQLSDDTTTSSMATDNLASLFRVDVATPPPRFQQVFLSDTCGASDTPPTRPLSLVLPSDSSGVVVHAMAVSGDGNYVAVMYDDEYDTHVGLVQVYRVHDATRVGNPLRFTQAPSNKNSTSLWFETQSAYAISSAQMVSSSSSSHVPPPLQLPQRMALNYDGTVLAIGNPNGQHRGPETGYVRVYRRGQSNSNNQQEEETWIPAAVDIIGTFRFGRTGKQVALDASGNRLVVATTRGNDGYYESNVQTPHAVRPQYWNDHVMAYDYNATTNRWQPVGTRIPGFHNQDYIYAEADMSTSHHVSLALSRNGQRLAFAYSVPLPPGDISLVRWQEAYRVRVYDYLPSLQEWVLVHQPGMALPNMDTEIAAKFPIVPHSIQVTLSDKDGGRLGMGVVWQDGTSRFRVLEYDHLYNRWQPVGSGETTDLGQNRYPSVNHHNNNADNSWLPHALRLDMDDTGHNLLVEHVVPEHLPPTSFLRGSDDATARSNMTVYQTPCAPHPDAGKPIAVENVPLPNSNACRPRWILQQDETFYGIDPEQKSRGRRVMFHSSTARNEDDDISSLSLGGFLDMSENAEIVATLTSSPGSDIDFTYRYEEFPYYDSTPDFSPDHDTYNHLLIWTKDVVHVVPPPINQVFNDVAVSGDGSIVVATTRQQILVCRTTMMAMEEEENGTGTSTSSDAMKWITVPEADTDTGGISGVTLSGDASVLAVSLTNRYDPNDGRFNDLIILLDTTTAEVLQTIEMTGSNEYINEQHAGVNWKHMSLSQDGSRLTVNAYSVTSSPTDVNDFVDRDNGPYIYDRNGGLWTLVASELPDPTLQGGINAPLIAKSIAMTADGSRIATVITEDLDDTTSFWKTGTIVILDLDSSGIQGGSGGGSTWLSSATIRSLGYHRDLCDDYFGISLSWSADGKRLSVSDLCGGADSRVTSGWYGERGSVTVLEQNPTTGEWETMGRAHTDDKDMPLSTLVDRSSFGLRTVLSADGNTLLVSDPGALDPWTGQPSGAVYRYTWKPDTCGS